MVRRSPRARDEFAFFNVMYEDGSQTSNRKVANDAIDQFDVDGSIKAILEAQDRDIAERSGRPRPPIKSIERASKK